MDPRIEQLYADSMVHTAEQRERNNELKAAVTERDPVERAARLRTIRERMAAIGSGRPDQADKKPGETV